MTREEKLQELEHIKVAISENEKEIKNIKNENTKLMANIIKLQDELIKEDTN